MRRLLLPLLLGLLLVPSSGRADWSSTATSDPAGDVALRPRGVLPSADDRRDLIDYLEGLAK
jgi:hypothetical protein